VSRAAQPGIQQAVTRQPRATTMPLPGAAGLFTPTTQPQIAAPVLCPAARNLQPALQSTHPLCAHLQAHDDQDTHRTLAHHQRDDEEGARPICLVLQGTGDR
jgi:hypothetical protein